MQTQNLKERFNRVKTQADTLKQETVRVSTQLEEAEKELFKVEKEILELSGASTVEEALKMFDTLTEEINSKLKELEALLGWYYVN